MALAGSYPPPQLLTRRDSQCWEEQKKSCWVRLQLLSRLLKHVLYAAAPTPIDGVLALTAGQAAFVNSTALVLSDIANTTSYVKFPPTPKAGAVSQVNQRLLEALHTIAACLLRIRHVRHDYESTFCGNNLD
jgi:hypothetical protein